jgi:hypothetical protein
MEMRTGGMLTASALTFDVFFVNLFVMHRFLQKCSKF